MPDTEVKMKALIFFLNFDLRTELNVEIPSYGKIVNVSAPA